MLAFIDALAKKSADLRVRVLGNTPEGRALPLLVLARPAPAQVDDLAKNGKPTVLIIGQLHGDEPAAGELAKLLERVNVLIVPRANPDGAFHLRKPR
jgi:murein tripeptide amidase MpaA